MKTKFLLSFVALLFPLISFAQLTSNLSIFSENEDKFFLYLNGKLQNEKPLPEVRLEGLTEPYYDAKVVFEDKSLPDLFKKIQVITPQGDPSYALYKIKQDKEGKLIIYFLSNVPLKENGLTSNDNKAFNTYGKDVTKDYTDQYSNAALARGNGGSTTIISSTTVTTTTINDDGANVLTNTQNAQPQVTQDQSTTSSSGSANGVSGVQHATISATDIEQGAIDHPETKKHRRHHKQEAGETATIAIKNDSEVTGHINNVNTTEPEEKKTFSDDASDTGLKAIMGAPPKAAAPAAAAPATGTVATAPAAPSGNPADTVGLAGGTVAAALAEGPPNCQPRDSAGFALAVQKITEADDEDAKLAAAKAVVDTNCVNTDQMVIMCRMLGRDRMRLELAKYAYPRTADPRNYSKVKDALETESNKSDLQEYIIYVNNNR